MLKRTLFGSVLIATTLSPLMAPAMDVQLGGIFGARVVLVVDGGAPQTVPAGKTSHEGIRVLSVGDGVAVVDIDGRHETLRLGAGPLRTEAAAAPNGSGSQQVRLVPDGQGHYTAVGTINGAVQRFMIDTGATLVAMGAEDARRAGIDFRKGTPAISLTANGPTKVWLLRLDRVQVGDIVLHGVDAAVHEVPIPIVLLGMSFLGRTNMSHEGDVLVLRRRY